MPLRVVWIEDGCISCGLCERICPAVFDLPDEAIVKTHIDLNANEDCIKQAAACCPVDVILFVEA